MWLLDKRFFENGNHMTYDEKQGEVSEAWLTRKENALRGQLAAVSYPNDQGAARAAEESSKEFGSFVSSYIAWELPKRRFLGIPSLDAETQRQCDELYSALERRIPSGPEGAEKRLAVMGVARLQAIAPVRDEGTTIADLLNEAQKVRNTRANTALWFTEEDAIDIVHKSDMVIQSLTNFASRESVERGSISPSPNPSEIDKRIEWDGRIARAQQFALENGYSGQPHVGNLHIYEERMKADGLYPPSPRSPSPSRQVHVSSEPVGEPRTTSDPRSPPAATNTPEPASSPPISPSSKGKRHLQDVESGSNADRSTKRPQLEERDRSLSVNRG